MKLAESKLFGGGYYPTPNRDKEIPPPVPVGATHPGWQEIDIGRREKQIFVQKPKREENAIGESNIGHPTQQCHHQYEPFW